MKKKSLVETNPYLKDPADREKYVFRSVETSCGVEGIKITNAHYFNIPSRGIKNIYRGSKSSAIENE